MKKFIFSVVVVGGLVFNLPVQALTVPELQALIAQLQAQIADLQRQLADAQGQEVAWCHDFNTNLRIGDTGAEVEALGIAFGKEGIIKGDFTQFDEHVASEVVGFQEKYKNEILAPFGLSRGTGFVGRGTRAKLNQLYGCKAPAAQNNAPIIDSVTGPSSLLVNQDGTWILKARDPEGGSLQGSVDWGDGSFVLGQEALNFTHRYSNSGVYTLRFTVADNQNLIAKSSTAVNIVSTEVRNNPPRLGEKPTVPASVPVNTLLPLKFTASDPDGDELSWSADWGAGGIADSCPESKSYGYSSYGYSSYSNYKKSWTREIAPQWSSPGIYTVTVTASDCNGGSDFYSFKVQVVESTSTPSIPSITVLSPNGGEQWSRGGVYTIKWTSVNADKTGIALYLTDQSTSPWNITEIARNVDPNLGSYSWTVPSTIPEGTKYKIQITGVVAGAVQPYRGTVGLSDESDNYFSIVSPASSLKNIEDQTASIADAISKLLESIKGFRP
ncbi:MAG: PKD domain-containing protein [Candidatus Wildermuthbacteria bacterium]|nr:PKD domain-containing protein [Candidatus Wildermuthbacteria bacterium]